MVRPTGVLLATVSRSPLLNHQLSGTSLRWAPSLIRAFLFSIKLLCSALAVPASDANSGRLGGLPISALMADAVNPPAPAPLQLFDWVSHDTMLTGDQEWKWV